jgi:UDP-N-acetylmuramate: L-alanyl-gamma-D-glutamyl-meso-diaminopimelate ligase
MRIHIIGVATTFMAGIALLARQAGSDVTASDSCIDPATRKLLESIDVQLQEGFHTENLAYKPDLVVTGSEVHPNNQELLETHRLEIPCIQGSEWLEGYILNDKWVKNVNPEDKKEKQKSNSPRISEKTNVKHAPKIPPEKNAKLKRTTQ